MEKDMMRPYRLASELAQLFNLEGNLDTVLSVTMYKLNEVVGAERSSIFLIDPVKQELTSYSSLDLAKHEIRMSKSSGVAGWVFENRKPAIGNDAYKDQRFCDDADKMTGFTTRNLICAPLIDHKENCSGTLQSLNKKGGDFATDDLELLGLAAGLVAVAINNSKLYTELLTTSNAQGKLIKNVFYNDKVENLKDEKSVRETVNLFYSVF